MSCKGELWTCKTTAQVQARMNHSYKQQTIDYVAGSVMAHYSDQICAGSVAALVKAMSADEVGSVMEDVATKMVAVFTKPGVSHEVAKRRIDRLISTQRKNLIAKYL
jgi:hypothetical protein